MSKEEKMLILQMVAEGKITPEQGAELLRAVVEGKPEASAPKHVSAPAAPATPAAPAQVAPRAASQAGIWADNVAKHAEEFADRASREGENLGKVLGESGENLGKVIARLFSGGFGVGGPQFEFHEEVRGELPVDGEIQVALTTSNGRITVDTWDDKGFRLDIRKTAHAATEAEAKELVKDGFEFSQDGLNLTARSKEIGSLLSSGYSVGFTLTLPRDRKASLRLSSSNGRLTAERVTGTHLRASTANGRIVAEGCAFAETEMDTANGRIELTGKPGNLRATTANGRIEGQIEGAGTWKMESANGRIEVNVKKEPGVAYEVDASTVAGRIEVTGLEDSEVLVDETRQKFGSRHYKARSKGFSDAAAKASLVASTTSGRVTVSL